MVDYRKIFAIKRNNELTIKKHIPDIQERAGIYFFYRVDELGMKYGYIGKAETNILERLASHLSGYTSHIDKSIRKHHLYNEKTNPYGYKICIVCYCEPKECDVLEQHYIVVCANKGYQMRNVESGGTVGKTMINERKQPKTYTEGKKQGKNDLRKQLNDIIGKYLTISLKKSGKLAENGLNKFWDLLKEE